MSTVVFPLSAATRAWRNSVLVFFALAGLSTASWVSRLPLIKTSLDASVTQMGILIFAVSAGSICGLFGSRHVLARLGAKKTISFTLALVAIGITVVGLGASVTMSFATVFAGLAVFGVGTGMCDVAMNLEGAAVERARKRTLMPLFHASWSLGTVTGAGIGALAAFASVPIVVHLAVVAGAVVIGAFVAARFLQPHEVVHDRANPRREEATPPLSIWRDPRTLLIGVIVLGMAFAEGSANDWLAIGMVSDRGLSDATGALLFGVFTSAMTVGRLVGGPVIDRVGRVTALRGSAALSFLGLAIVIAIPALPFTVAGIVMWGLGASLGFPIGMSAAADDPRHAAARVSAVATIGYGAFLIGPPVIGFIGERVGILNALVLVLALIVLAGCVSGFARTEQVASVPEDSQA